MTVFLEMRLHWFNLIQLESYALRSLHWNKIPVGFLSKVCMSNPENSVVGFMRFSVFHKIIVIIISCPHLSTFLYSPSMCHVSKCGIYWGNEFSWLIPHCSAKLSPPSIWPLHQTGSSLLKNSDTGLLFGACTI